MELHTVVLISILAILLARGTEKPFSVDTEEVVTEEPGNTFSISAYGYWVEGNTISANKTVS